MGVSQRRKEAASKENSLENQKTLISKDIEQVKKQCDSLKKAIKIMESEFVGSIKKAELGNNMALIIKVNGLKRKSEETKQDLVLSKSTYRNWMERTRNWVDTWMLKFPRQYRHVKKKNEILLGMLNISL